MLWETRLSLKCIFSVHFSCCCFDQYRMWIRVNKMMLLWFVSKVYLADAVEQSAQSTRWDDKTFSYISSDCWVVFIFDTREDLSSYVSDYKVLPSIVLMFAVFIFYDCLATGPNFCRIKNQCPPISTIFSSLSTRDEHCKALKVAYAPLSYL